MSWYAIDAVDEAVETTRSFLFPFDLGRWLRLAVIVFFLSSASSGNIQFPQTGSSDAFSAMWEELLPLLVVLGLIFLTLFVVFGLIGSIMRFVLLDSIHAESIHVRQYFRERLGKGARLFLFEFGVIILVALPFVASGLAFTTGLVEGSASVFGMWMVLLIPVVLVGALLLALLFGFTTSFVAPVMIVEDCGVLAGWRQFWPTLKGEWKQYALYVVLNWFLSFVAGVIFWLVIVFLVLAVGVGVVVPTFISFELSESIGIVVLLLSSLVGVLFLLVSAFLVHISITVYFRYYSLLVLRKTNAEFDLVPYADDSSDSASTGSE